MNGIMAGMQKSRVQPILSERYLLKPRQARIERDGTETDPSGNYSVSIRVQVKQQYKQAHRQSEDGSETNLENTR